MFRGGQTMKYIKPQTEIFEFEGYVATSDYEGLMNSNHGINDKDFPIHGGSTDLGDLGGEEW